MLKKFIIPAVFIIIVFLIGTLFLGRNGLLNIYRIKQENQRLAAEIVVQQSSLTAKTQQIHLLRTDSFYMESVARTLYGMSKKGEQIYIFVNRADSAAAR